MQHHAGPGHRSVTRPRGGFDTRLQQRTAFASSHRQLQSCMVMTVGQSALQPGSSMRPHAMCACRTSVQHACWEIDRVHSADAWAVDMAAIPRQERCLPWQALHVSAAVLCVHAQQTMCTWHASLSHSQRYVPQPSQAGSHGLLWVSLVTACST